MTPAPAASLLVWKAPDAESAEAPEFQYLLSHLLLQARQVFARVELCVAEAPPPPRDVDAVLLLGRANVLVARRSFAAMRQALLAGAAEVRPYRLADLGERTPIYTLRGYELAEAALLARPPAAAVPASHLPVALLTREWFVELAAAVPTADLLVDPSAYPDPAPRPAAGAGIHHEFIDYYGEARADVLPFVPASAREVIEIGCGRGATGALLRERLGCRVTGVELNPVVARQAARRLDRVLAGDVETLAIPGRYDLVLALELLEHLVEPERFLARLPDLLAPGGRAILSVPNVGHHAVVEDLVAGRWDYLPIGILCYTHYRFFTARTLDDWLRRAGLERFRLVPQRTAPPERPERFTAGFPDADLESLTTKGFFVLVEA